MADWFGVGSLAIDTEFSESSEHTETENAERLRLSAMFKERNRRLQVVAAVGGFPVAVAYPVHGKTFKRTANLEIEQMLYQHEVFLRKRK